MDYLPAEETHWRRSQVYRPHSMQDILLSTVEREAQDVLGYTEIGTEKIRTLMHVDYDYEAEDLAEDIDRYADSEFIAQLPLHEARRAMATLEDTAYPQWLYGQPRLHADTLDGELIAQPGYRDVRAVGTLGKYVLSGLLGAEIAAQDPSLIEKAKNVTASPLEQAVFIGGAAIAGRSYNRQHMSGLAWGYDHEQEYGDGRAVEFFVGGDIHGDFATSKLTFESWNVTDTVHRTMRHYYAPVIEGGGARAYHSVEPNIAAALLAHLVKGAGAVPGELHGELTGLIAQRSKNEEFASVGGAFGDYGHQDGSWAAAMFRGALAGEDPVEANFIVAPQSERRLILSATGEGVDFYDGRIDDATHEIVKTRKAMTLKNEEIPEYISYLACGAGGRTSTDQIIKIMDVLKTI